MERSLVVVQKGKNADGDSLEYTFLGDYGFFATQTHLEVGEMRTNGNKHVFLLSEVQEVQMLVTKMYRTDEEIKDVVTKQVWKPE